MEIHINSCLNRLLLTLRLLCACTVIAVLSFGTDIAKAASITTEQPHKSVSGATSGGGSGSTATDPANTSGNLSGTVTDSASGRPFEGVTISVDQGGRQIASSPSDQFGHFTIHNLTPGGYSAIASFVGFQPETLSVEINPNGATTTIAFRLEPATLMLQAITVTARTPVAVDTRTGDQVFQQNDYHGAPVSTTSQILQESIAGAARAPTGEVHIRGQHAEYTYYVDGVPVPSGISGSLNELFDPATVNRIDFQTGGWDAEYGGKNAAVINVLTRIPTGRADFSSYVGSYHSNGQTMNLSRNMGKWGWLVSGNRQETSMREEPVVGDSATNKPFNFHNYGKDFSGFGKLQYIPSSTDLVYLDANLSQTKFEVPFDSTGGVNLDDRQKDDNSFVNLSWRHQFSIDTTGQERGAELFAGAYYRHGSLKYTPGAIDDPSFIFYPDTTPYNLSENRSFNTEGIKADYRWKPVHKAEFKAGIEASITSGHELFGTKDINGDSGPASNSNLSGHDLGAYLQTVWSPYEWTEIRAGIRSDAHKAPFAHDQHQVSPRLKLSLFPNPANTIYLYYGRLFVPTNVEDLRAITDIADSGVVTAPTLPERDDFYEGGFVHRFPIGVLTKISVYHKSSLPGIDDNTVPGSAITTSVNLARVRITGVELVTEVQPHGPISGYLNFAVCHAYGSGPVTGGFFPTDIADVPGGWFDLDHDQRISAVASMTYSEKRAFVSATGIYGSGLTNGADITSPIGTGLFDFNKDIHVDPNFILNASAGYSILFENTVIRPQLYVDNVFDSKYILKGAFFSGASYGRPRSVQLKVDVGL